MLPILFLCSFLLVFEILYNFFSLEGLNFYAIYHAILLTTLIFLKSIIFLHLPS